MKAIFLILFATMAAAFAPTAQAAQTQWQDLGGGKARMVALLDPQTMNISGVVEFQLEPGWKTYWREPGGSGIPPDFDFTGSRHFVAGEIGYPVPARLEAGGSVFAGYKGNVKFTFSGRANGDAEDGSITLDLLAGVCEEICIPATASMQIEFSELRQSDPAAMLAIQQARAALPGQPGETFRIESARLEDGGQLVVDSVVPGGPEMPALFAEGPAGWYLRPAEALDIGDKHATFKLDLADIPDGADPATQMLRYTLVKGGQGIEQWLAPTK